MIERGVGGEAWRAVEMEGSGLDLGGLCSSKSLMASHTSQPAS